MPEEGGKQSEPEVHADIPFLIRISCDINMTSTSKFVAGDHFWF